LLRAPISVPIEEREAFGLRFAMCRVGRADFEIMESIEPTGLVARFVDQRGEGLHHIAFEIDDAERAMRLLRQSGVPVLGGEKPVELANLKAFFIHPSCFGGILIEFVENLHPWLAGVRYLPRAGAQGIDVERIVGLTATVDDVDSACGALSSLLGAVVEGGDSRQADALTERVCRIGDIHLALQTARSESRKGFQSVCLEVVNFHESVARLRALGAEVHETLVHHPEFHGVPIQLVGRG